MANIDKLEQQMSALKERLKTAKTRESSAKKKRETKQKILLGAMCLAWMESDPSMKKTIMDRMDKFLTRNTDRKYFLLEPTEGPAKPEPNKTIIES